MIAIALEADQAGGGETAELMIAATHLKAHRTAASLLKRGLFPGISDAPRAKLHAVCDSQGAARTLFLSAGQVSDCTGVAALLGTMPAAKVLLADKGYDADWLRDVLADRKIEACIP